MDTTKPLKTSDLSTAKATEQLSETTTEKYKKIISTLDTVDWFGEAKLCQYQGMLHLPSYMEKIMKVQENFKAQPSDIVLCSFPKSGTGWLKALGFAIVTRSKYVDSESPLLTKISHAVVPFLENDLLDSSATRDPDLPLVATHITYSSLPPSIISSGCKIVYICRDLKDVIVSMYYFSKKNASASNIDLPFDMNALFEMYCKGVSIYGPYWDHVLGYWKASQEHPEKVLFLKFQDVKKDPIPVIKKMAEFIGHPFSHEEEKSGVVQKVVDLCSIETLSKLEVSKSGVFCEDNEVKLTNESFFRKGDVGDWKNHFSLEMAARLDQILKEKLGTLEL